VTEDMKGMTLFAATKHSKTLYENSE